MVTERLRHTSLYDKSRHSSLMVCHNIQLRQADLYVPTFEIRCYVNPHTEIRKEEYRIITH